MILGWPLVLTNLAQVAITATDMMLIGRLGGETLAAGVLASSLYQSLLIFCMGLVSATLPMIAITLGEHRHAVREVRRTVRQGLWSAGLISLPIWLVMWNTELILLAMGQAKPVAGQAVEFMHTMQWGLLPYLGFVVIRSFMSALERPFWTLVVAAPAIVANAVIGYALIFGALGLPALGLAGAGIASTCSSCLLFAGAAAVAVRHRHFRRYRLFGRWWQPDLPRLLALWRLGLPMAITFGFETSIFYAAVIVMGLLGPVALAAHAIVFQFAALAFMVPLSFGQVATVRVGRAFGAGDAAGAQRAGWSAFGLGVGFMSMTAATMFLAPRILIAAFLDLDSPLNADVVDVAASFFAFAAVFQIVDGAQAVCSGMLRGLGDTKVPMLLAAVGYWGIGAPCGAWLAFRMGGGGVYLGLAIGLGAVALLMGRRWIKKTTAPG